MSIQAQTLYWQKLTSDYNVYDILYDGQQNLYFTGTSGNWYFWRSSDLGLTWTRTGNGSPRLYRIAIDSNNVLWGGDATNGGIYKSTNQGDAWINTLPTNEKIYSITVSPNNWIWAGTNDGKVVYSSDQGNTWERVTVTTVIMWSITSNNLNHIFVGAGSGNSKIYRTTNLGASWELVYSYQYFSIRGIVIDDSNVIYANRYNARLVSSDNGNTWTTIDGPSLERLYIDKYHRIYASPVGYRSLDNCVTWTRIGPAEPTFVEAYTFVDSLLFAGTSRGVYLHDPSFQPYIGDNYFPLALGNKWQFNKECSNSGSEDNTIYFVERDSIIMGKNYYLLQGSINDWLRYDNDEDKLFLRWNDSDYVVMNYALNQGSSFSQITFNTHQLRTVGVRAPIILSIFDSSYHSKGYSYSQMYFGSFYYHSESLGDTRSEFDYSGPGGYSDYCINRMTRAILYDSTGVKYYSDHVKPIISFQPILITNEFDLNWSFSVDHEYTYFENNSSENFVDSVILYSHYSNDDSTFMNMPILAVNTPNSINYTISYLLDSTLMKNDYSFYYKIYAVDKGIVPEHSTKPDSGYYELVYDPNVSVEIANNKIIDYQLMQNYPNPFNPTTVIDYSIKEEGNVELVIYDVLGKVVEKLVDERKIPGNYSLQFDASNLSSGLYFYSLRVNDFVNTKKMLLIK
ncbi:MAG TPA: T9SS type A sorting domain-containing protein [Ignavibacteriaceae bacterium]|nr:T9SS type A sorting domain-containing protein [Ignavibacteriaceae bacterium]